MLDQTLDTAERLGELEEARACDEVDRLLLGGREERHHSPEVAHLTAGDLVARMAGKARVEHPLDGGMTFEERRDLACVLAVLPHPDRERLDPAQHQPGVERSGDRPERLLEEVETFRECVVVGRDESADRVAVAAEVLGGRVHDDVRAQRERLLQVRRREGVVDDEERAHRMGSVGGAADVDHVQQRVRRRLHPDEPHRVVEVRREFLVELRSGHVREAIALRLVHLRRHSVHAAVHVGDQHDPLAGIDEVHQRRRRSEPRAERDPVLRLLEAGERLLQRGARGVRDACVVVALVLADRLLHVRRRLVDRCRDRARGGIGLLPHVNRARLEVHRSGG